MVASEAALTVVGQQDWEGGCEIKSAIAGFEGRDVNFVYSHHVPHRLRLGSPVGSSSPRRESSAGTLTHNVPFTGA